MAEVARVHGGAAPGAFYGLQPRMFRVEIAGVHTNFGAVNSAFELAVRAIGSVASIVILGTPAAGAFVVAVDNSFDGRGDQTAAATLAALTGGTVTEVSLVGATLA